MENDALTKEVRGKNSLAGKPKLQDKVRKALAKLYGENPKKIIVPDGLGVLLTGAGPGWPTTSRLAKAANET